MRARFGGGGAILRRPAARLRPSPSAATEVPQCGFGLGAIDAGFVTARGELLRRFLARREPRCDLRLFPLCLCRGFARAFDGAQGLAMRLPGFCLGVRLGAKISLHRFSLRLQFVRDLAGQLRVAG